MRNISFSLTTEQFLAGTKTVTRRLRWDHLQTGDVLMGCRKCMGLKPGEKIEKLREIVVVDVRREPLSRMIDDPEYGKAEAIKEGFPEMTGAQFVEFFCRANKCDPSTAPNRIEFSYL